MRTPPFVADQKLFAGDSDLTNDKANNMESLRVDASGAASLLVHEQATPDMTLYVEPARNIFVNGSNIDFLGSNTPTFTAPSSGSRTDLVTINAAGTIVVYAGTSGVNNYPTTERPLAEVLLVAGDTAITDDRITDVRQFFGASVNSNAQVETNKLGTEASDAPVNTIFTINSGTFIPGSGASAVFIDGIRKVLGDDYVELNSTTIRLLAPVLDTQKVTIITNQASAFDLGNKVSKTGDTMSGALTTPTVNFGSATNKIYYSGNDLIFDDGNNTPKTLTELTTSAGLTVNHHEVVASSSQTVFALPFSYVLGSNKMQVFMNGLLQWEGLSNDYVETDTTTITFNSGLVAGSRVTFHAVV